jgi:anti-sigma regulatory factor (Ser/Thr protein kinase)
MKDVSISVEVDSNGLVIRPVVALVREFLLQLKPFSKNDRLLISIELVINEALVNVLKHAYLSDEKKKVLVQISVEEDKVIFCFIDWGLSFDPGDVPTPDLEKPAEGGLGLWLIRQFVDELDYKSEPDGKNVLRLVKKVPNILIDED